MNYKCLDCGTVFDAENAHTYSESRSYWGMPCSEEFMECPNCKSDCFEETHSCELCGAEFLQDELYGGVCKGCIDDYKFDIDACIDIGQTEKQTIEINSFFASMFTADQIDSLLLRELKSAHSIMKVDCTPFIENDLSWFGERLIKEVVK